MSDTTSPANGLISVSGLSRRFDTRQALENISLQVPPGVIFGLIGGNGAGKTTLIRHLLGMLKAQSGSVRVFGLDPVSSPVEVLGRIGYLSEDRDLPNWMRVRELLGYTRAFYPAWDSGYAAELLEAFQLDGQAVVKTLSRGQRARLGLLISLAHRPQLLIFDEPSSGLDPVVRRDILGSIIRTIADDGRTVFFSSHLLDEVEQVADHVAIIHCGKIMLTSTMDQLRETHRRMTLRFRHATIVAPTLTGALSAEGSGHEWTYICHGETGELRNAATVIGAQILDETLLTLDEIFVSRVLQ